MAVVDCILQHNGVILTDFPLRDDTWTNLHGGCCVDCKHQEDGTPFAPATGSDAFCKGLHEKCYYPKGQCPNHHHSHSEFKNIKEPVLLASILAAFQLPITEMGQQTNEIDVGGAENDGFEYDGDFGAPQEATQEATPTAQQEEGESSCQDPKLIKIGAILRIRSDLQYSRSDLQYNRNPSSSDEDTFWVRCCGAFCFGLFQH